MFTSRSIAIVLFGLLSLAAPTWADTAAFQGVVKGQDGNPISGAEVTLQGTSDKKATMTKTDKQGRFAFQNLSLGEYSLSATANGMATAKVEHIKTKASGPVAVDFALKPGTAKGTAAVKKRRVWVQETGSNMGRWEEVDETGEVSAQSKNTKRFGRDQMGNMQSKGIGLQPSGTGN